MSTDSFNEVETATILAALRYWQRNVLPHSIQLQPPEMDIATSAGALEPLDVNAIDDLCERLNCASDKPILGVVIDGASITVISDRAGAFKGIPVFIVEYMTKNMEGERTFEVPQDNDTCEKAIGHVTTVFKSGIDLVTAYENCLKMDES